MNITAIFRFGFSYGKVHFVIMSTEHDFRKGTKQYIALKEHLKCVDRGVTPWLVFAGHRSELADNNIIITVIPLIKLCHINNTDPCT